jgi:threonine synthase
MPPFGQDPAMRYISTRGGTEPMPFQEAVLTGLAPDGGLLLPERLPDLGAELDSLRGLSFVETAVAVLGHFVDDIEPSALRALIERSFASFDDPEITPLRQLGGLNVLELFHGPTLAFKDIALQFLGNLFEHILGARHTSMNIVGATSGDTGSAAIAGVRGKQGIGIFILYPAGRTSALQELQMTSVLDDHVHCLAIEGSFDDCQAIMKSLFNDAPFKSRHRLGAVNSVNWARVLMQIVYYVHTGLGLDDGGRRKVSFSVPTGNFGDIFAGYLALRMGVPIERLVLATNENDILSVFFNTGVYRRGTVRYTISPSMDIQVASNFERFLFYRLGGDSARLRAFMEAFSAGGSAQIDDGHPIEPHIIATSIDAEATLATIRDVYREHGYVVDPHTAVGIAAAQRLEIPAPVVCLATAHPAKFPESVDRAVGMPIARHERLERLKSLPTRRTVLPASVDAVRAFVAEHAISA